MSAIAFSSIEERTLGVTDAGRLWRIVGMAMLPTRFIQGFIYWGGGSRRFVYAPSKLDPTAPTWMANKFQTAMPGALFGMDHVISFMLTHFYILYAGVILFSAAELIFGAMLMAGLLTRLAALATMGMSVVLMAMFGWQGATCIDEWTMAACNLAMGATILMAGGSAYSLDNVLLRRNPSLARRPWFRWISGSLPLPDTGFGGFRNLALAIFAFVAVYNVGTYSYYRGSVFTPFHNGPVSPTVHHLSLTQAVVLSDGGVRFHVYLDAGTPEAPVHVIAADLLGGDGHVVAHWDAAALTKLAKSAFANDYDYNKFSPGPFGFRAPMGAAATVTLPSPGEGAAKDAKIIRLTDVDGRTSSADVQPAQ
jgi:thiosulfate dehydrogenase [quinone] large subunit